MYKLRKKFPDISILCTTATATTATLTDIRKTFDMPNCFVIKGNLTRLNLQYFVKQKTFEYQKEIIDLLHGEFKDKTGIIYCLTRDEADKMNNLLNVIQNLMFFPFF